VFRNRMADSKYTFIFEWRLAHKTVT
jgi:hypothetical protein